MSYFLVGDDAFELKAYIAHETTALEKYEVVEPLRSLYLCLRSLRCLAWVLILGMQQQHVLLLAVA